MSYTLHYWLDQNNIISKVDDNWDSYLDEASRSARALSTGVIGKPLIDFICDDQTRMYVRASIDYVRVKRQTLQRPYRCDTPDTKRYWQMTVSIEDNNWLRVSHQLLRTEPLPQKIHFQTLLRTPQAEDRPRATNAHYLFRCSICNRLKLPGRDAWDEADALSLPLKDSISLDYKLKVIYGVCPSCMAQIKNEANVNN